MATQVLIIGAGPTGLVLAIALARRGVIVRIIDKNSGPGQASRAMAVHARTLEFYRQLGFAEVVVNQGIKIEAIHLREHGEDIVELPLKDIGAGLSPYPFVLAYPQDDHERLLVAQLAAEGVQVEWNTELESFTQDEWGVRAVLEKTASATPAAALTCAVAMAPAAACANRCGSISAAAPTSTCTTWPTCRPKALPTTIWSATWPPTPLR
jgi:2-polyprenyl-6-methoxyphenol hydroxylase-like FAD-dependent oxidoreductase